MKTILKELIKWVFITLIIGCMVWMVTSLYKFIKDKVKGH